MKSALRFPLPVLVVTVVGFAFRTAVPMSIGWNSPHDDSWSAQVTASLLSGEWFGTWNSQAVPHMLLAKGPGYPLYVASTKWAGLTPVQLSYAAYLCGAVLLALWMRRTLSNRAGVLVYVVLAFSPMVFAPGFSRVYRDQLVAALALLALGAAANLGHLIAKAIRAAMPFRCWDGLALIALAGVLGASVGWLRITRGDTVWVIASTVAIITLQTVAGLRKAVSFGRSGARVVVARFLPATIALLLVAVIAQVPGQWVQKRNMNEYGVPLIDDYSSGAFGTAMSVWASLPGSAPGQVISTEQRALAYQLSPQAALLEAELEDPTNGWRRRQCRSEGNPQEECEDFASYGGYMGWALRDAAVRAAELNDPLGLQLFFGELADELSDACSSGAVVCGSSGLSPDVGQVGEISKRLVVNRFAGYVQGSIANGNSAISGGSHPESVDEALVEAWSQSTNGLGGLLSLVDTVDSAEDRGLSSVRGLVRDVYAFFSLPALVIAVALLFSKRLWVNPVGWLCISAGGGWVGNLLIVALFRAATLRRPGETLELYTMASQSYFLVAVTCGCICLAQWVTLRVRQGKTRVDALPRVRDRGTDEE